MRWGYADQSAIIRSAQKDAQEERYLQEMIDDQLQSKFKIYDSRLSQTAARCLHLALTTLLGQKTLGEEYCSLLQVDTRNHDLPGFFKRLAVAADGLGILLGSSWMRLAKIVKAVGAIYSGLFYAGHVSSYNLVKEIIGLRYIHHPRKAPKIDGNTTLTKIYTLLGITMVISGATQLIGTLKTIRSETETNSSCPASPEDICTLCLDRRRNGSKLPCGHVFCWDCLCRWLEARKECPLCRTAASHADILYLRNLDD